MNHGPTSHATFMKGNESMSTTDTRTIHPHLIPRQLTWAIVVIVACSLLYGAYRRPDDGFSDVPARDNVNGSVVSAAPPAMQTMTDTTPGAHNPLRSPVPASQSSIAVGVPDVHARGQSVMNSMVTASTDEYQTDIYEKELLSGDSLAHTIMQTHGLSTARPPAGQPRTQTSSQFTATEQTHGETRLPRMDR